MKVFCISKASQRVRRDGTFGESPHMVERITKRAAPSLRSAGDVTERGRSKVEKNAKKASSSLLCDSVMTRKTGFEFVGCATGPALLTGSPPTASAYII
jgi:hypothetical protein